MEYLQLVYETLNFPINKNFINYEKNKLPYNCTSLKFRGL